MKADEFLDFDRGTYLAETDKLLGLPSGWSAAQIGVESNNDPNAVSPKQAMGLAQVVPKTLRTLSKRAGRQLNPFNEVDALYIHREVMRENLAKFGNVEDASRAYNSGWEPEKWGNAETAAYVPKIKNRMGKGGEPAAPAPAAGMSAAAFLDAPDMADEAPAAADPSGMSAEAFLDAPERSVGDKAVDIGKSVGGAVVSAVGAVPTGLGKAVQQGGEMLLGMTRDEAERLAAADGTPEKAQEYYERANRGNPVALAGRGLGWVGEKIGGVADRIRGSRSPEAQAAAQGSMPEGDITQPSTWTAGSNPSLEGAAHVVSDVAGSVAPVVATAVATRGRSAGTQVAAGTTVGASQGIGAAINEARSFIGSMSDEQLASESPVFREMLAAKMSPADARALLTKRAEDMAALEVAPVSAAGGAATSALLGKVGGNALQSVGRSAAIRALTGGVVGGTEEAIQEVGEGTSTRSGINRATGMKRDVMAGTFGEAAAGFVGGAGPGGFRGATSKAKVAPAVDATTVLDAEAEAAEPVVLALPAPVVRVDAEGNARMDGSPPPVVDEKPARVAGRAEEVRSAVREELKALGLPAPETTVDARGEEVSVPRATPTPITVDEEGSAALQGDTRTPSQANDQRYEAEAAKLYPKNAEARAEYVATQRARELGYEARMRELAERANQKRSKRVKAQEATTPAPSRPSRPSRDWRPTGELGVVSKANEDGSTSYFFAANPDEPLVLGKASQEGGRPITSITSNEAAQPALLRAALVDGPVSAGPKSIGRAALKGVPGAMVDRFGATRMVGREADRSKMASELNRMAAKTATERAGKLLQGDDLDLATAAIAVDPRKASSVLRKADVEAVRSGLREIVPGFVGETQDVPVSEAEVQERTSQRLKAQGVGVDQDFVDHVSAAGRDAVKAGHMTRDEFFAATRAAREGNREAAIELLRKSDERRGVQSQADAGRVSTVDLDPDASVSLDEAAPDAAKMGHPDFMSDPMERRYAPLWASAQQTLAQALRDIEQMGVPQAWLSGIQGYFVTLGNEHGVMAFFSKASNKPVRGIGMTEASIPSDLSSTEDHRLFRGRLIHELAHSADHDGSAPRSASDPRLALGEDGSTGEVSGEIIAIYESGEGSLAELFQYPLDGWFEGRYSQATTSSEMHAQIVRAYFTNRAELERLAPKAYEYATSLVEKPQPSGQAAAGNDRAVRAEVRQEPAGGPRLDDQRGVDSARPAGAAERGNPADAQRQDGLRDQRAGGLDGRPEPTRDGGGRQEGGSLAPLPGAPTVQGASGPDAGLNAVAEQYARDNGIDFRRQSQYVEVDPERAARIAAAYDAMPHAPQDQKVREAYENLIRQTTAQYRALEAAGYKFWFFDETNDPYAGNPWNAMRDLRANRSMGVFASEAGFGSGATDINVEDNPLLADTGIEWPYGSPDGQAKRVLANDLFRAVHDALGHGIEGAGFRAQGEENAWQAHARLFTGSALAALTSETRGQNSWLNYGPHGETNRTAKVEDTVFADQKTGLMPEWTWTEGFDDGTVAQGVKKMPRMQEELALFDPLAPKRSDLTMNWIIENPTDARRVLKLPRITSEQSITKRQLGEAISKFRTAKVDPKDYSQAAVRKLGAALADEVQWYDAHAADSGIDWYSDKFQRSVDVLAEKVPSLRQRENRGLFTALLAITSDGTDVQLNLNFTMEMYEGFMRGERLGDLIPAGAAQQAKSYRNNAVKLQEMIDSLGQAQAIEFLLERMYAADVKAEMKMLGEKSPASDYPDDAMLPRAAVYLGPKLGAFYANLMGETGYLTMDRWWNRTINRYRGHMVTSATDQSLDSFRELTKQPDLSDEGVILQAQAIAKEKQRQYNDARERGEDFRPSKLETLSTTIDKNARTELADSPTGPKDRAFQIAVVKEAQRNLAERGIEADVAGIQATIWYYEKELFEKIGVKGKGRISYEEAARVWSDRRERSAVQGAGRDVAQEAAGDAEAGLGTVQGSLFGEEDGDNLARLEGELTTRRGFIRLAAGIGAWINGVRPAKAAPANPALGAVMRKGDVKASLQWIADNGSTPAAKSLAKQLIDLLPDSISMRVIKVEKTGFGARFSDPAPVALASAYGLAQIDRKAGGVTLWMRDGDKSGLSEETLLHEATHAIILARYDMLNVYSANPGKFGNRKADEAIQQYVKVWKEFRKEFEREASKDGAPAWMTEPFENPDEFITYALTSPELQAALKARKYKGTTLWQRFKDAVRGIMGWVKGPEPTWLDAALMASQDVLQAAKGDRGDFDVARQLEARMAKNREQKSTLRRAISTDESKGLGKTAARVGAGAIKSTAPITATVQAANKTVDRIGEEIARLTGVKALGAKAVSLAERALDAKSSWTWLEKAKQGLVSDYGLPEEYLDAKLNRQVRENKLMREAKTTLDRLSAMTPDQLAVAYQWLQEKPDTARERELLGRLPADQQAAMQRMKTDIDGLSKEAVTLGLITQETYERNKMAYVHRSYKKYEAELTGSQAVARQRAQRLKGDQFKGRGMELEASLERVRGELPDELKGMKLEMLEKRDAAGKLVRREYLVQGTQRPASLSDYTSAGVWEVRDATKGGHLKVWRDFTLAERQRMGEIEDARYGFARTMVQGIRDVETSRFLRWTAMNYGKDSDAGLDVAEISGVHAALGSQTFTRDQWVKVPETKIKGTSVARYGDLAGKFVPAVMYSDIAGVMELRNGLWDKLLGAWKISKTALSPGVHVNNVMSNFIMADLADVGVNDIRRALETIVRAKAGDASAKAMIERYDDSGAESGSFAANEIKTSVIEPLLKQIAADEPEAVQKASLANVIALAAHGQLREAGVAATKTLPGRALSGSIQAMVKAYQSEDAVFRLAKFMNELDGGKTDVQAGKAARDAFLNYDINAPWVRAARRSVLPFISFTYRAVPLLAKAVVTKPWKIAKYAALGEALSMLAYMALGDGGDEEKEKRLLPEEMQGTSLGLPKMVRLPWNDKDSDPLWLDVRRWLPAGDLTETSNSKAAVPLPSYLSIGGPLSLLIDFYSNTNWRGDKIVKPTDTAGEVVMKVSDVIAKFALPNLPTPGLGWVLREMGAPVDTGMLDPFGWVGIEKGLDGAKTGFGKEVDPAIQTARALGVKLDARRLRDEAVRIGLDAKAKEKAIETDARALGRKMGRGEIDREEGQRRIAREVEKLKELGKKTREKLSPASTD